MKKTILHIIDNLGRGGAETMLVTVVKQLPAYHNIIVTLRPENEFENEIACDGLYCLHMHSPYQVPMAAIKLRKIIKDKNVDIVHSHLFWSTVVARLGTPKNISLITTIHAFVASSLEYTPWYMKLTERLTYKIKKSTIIAVAKGALEEYFRFIDVKPHKAYHLYTFVDTQKFTGRPTAEASETLRVITVGNLKEQKNHRFLLKAFKNLQNQNISLDIYGKGPLQQELQQYIDENNLKITLQGQANNIQEQLGKYDLFVMSSLYEGFALSVLEAMAVGIPILLTDIPSFKEQCGDTATYYQLNNVNDFTTKLLYLQHNRQQMAIQGDKSRQRALANFSLIKHLESLKDIYANTIAEKPALLKLKNCLS